MTERSFSERLLAFYRENKRDLPWRHNRDPYLVWVSEIMLQQTRVEAVKTYFERFKNELPTVFDLAAVPDEVLMKLWQGLGYYSRARNLKKAAMQIVSEHGGRLPSDTDALMRLSGIGRYTAAAIASIAFGKRAAAVDGNVLRVYARVFGDARDIADDRTKRAFEAEVLALMPEESGTVTNDCGDFTEGFIELGATVCVPNGKPLCEQCPMRTVCAAHLAGEEERFPVKSKKATRRIEERTVLLLTDGKKLGLVKRPSEGLLASLFEPLCFVGAYTEEAIKSALTAYGIRKDAILSVRPAGTAKHIFTHIEWHMTGYLVLLRDTECRAEIAFATKDEIETVYAVPSAYRHYMKMFSAFLSEYGEAPKTE